MLLRHSNVFRTCEDPQRRAGSVTRTRLVGLDFEAPVPEDVASLLCDDIP